MADPLRACSSRGPICSGGAAWEQLLPWVPWGIWVLEGFFPPDSSGNKNLEGVDEVREPGSGHGVGGERVKPGTSWASDFRVIEADRGWLLVRFILCYFFFPPVMGGLGEGL